MNPQQKLQQLISTLKDLPATRKQIEEFVVLLFNVIKISKEEFQVLSNDNIKVVNGYLKKLQTENDDLFSQVKIITANNVADFQLKLFEMENIIATLKVMKGEKGEPGRHGKDGVDGVDGTPDTPEEIRNKLEDLVGEQRLSAKAIKDLPEFFEQLETSKRPTGSRGPRNFWQMSDVDIDPEFITINDIPRWNGSYWVNAQITDEGIRSINGLTGLLQDFDEGTSGTDFNIVSTGTTHTFNIPTASAVNRGALSSADWTTFNNKLGTISGIAAGGELAGTYPNPTLVNSAVIGKVLTGYTSGAGTVAATDTILQAIQKLNGNTAALVTGVSSVFSRTGAVTAQSGDYNTSQVTELTNLYFTNARAIGSVLTGYASVTGTITAADTILSAIGKLNGNTAALVTGVSSVFGRTGAVVQVSGDYNTSQVTENTNLYFTTARVLATALSGLSVTGGAITSADTVLSAFGKVQNQINGLIGGVFYQGSWNATTNSPTLTSSVGTKGYYYVVSVAGSTNLNGITDWKIGDWAIYNGAAWEKVDNTDAVTSVNSAIGAVSLTGTAGRISVSGTVWDIDAAYVGQASITTVGTLTSGTIGAGFTAIANARLANSSLTIGSTNIALGGTSTTLAGLTSVTSTSFVGALTGNADTATKWLTARTLAITGDIAYTSGAFDGSGNATGIGTLATVNGNVGGFGSSTSIPTFTVNAKGLITAASGNAVIAPAGTLTGATLASNVLTSSLTTVGTLGTLTVTAAPTFSAMTAGSVLFAGTAGLLSQDNTNFIYSTAGGMRIGPTNALIGTQNKLSVTASANDYHGMLVVNASAGASASGDLIFGNDLGGANDYMDIGLNSSGYSSASFTLLGASDAYFITGPGGNLNNIDIATGKAGTAIKFGVGGLLAANEVARITSLGLGIGTTSPSAQFHMAGNVSAAAWGTTGIKIKQPGTTITDTSSSGTVASNYVNSYGAHSLAATNTTTYSLVIGNFFQTPTAGTNVTITSSLAAYFQGDALLSGSFALGANVPIAKWYISGSHSRTAWGVNGAGIRYAAATYTDSSSSGTVASMAVHGFAGMIIAASSTTTYTNAYGLYVAAPTEGTNVTFTNVYAIWGSGNIGASSNLQLGTVASESRITISGSKTLDAWGTGGAIFRASAGTYTDGSTAASGTVATASMHSFAAHTIAATNTGVTVSDGMTVYIGNVPIAGTNVTITRPWSIYINAGDSYTGGGWSLGTKDKDAKLNVLSTTEQFRLAYNATNFVAFTVASTGDLLIAPTTTSTPRQVSFSGSLALPTVSVSANTTLDKTHYTVRVDASGANRTITLPAASGATGRIYIIKKSDSSANTVTIDGNASETIDGVTTKVLSTQYSGYMIQCNGTGWDIIATF